MGLTWRKTKRVGPARVNFTQRGYSSTSVRAGRVGYNTRRGFTVRLPFGLTWRWKP